MKRHIVSALMVLIALSAAAEELSSAQVFTAYGTVRPGDRLPVAVKLTVAEGWHTYAKEPGDSGMPPSFKFSGVEGIEVAEWQFPPAKAFKDSIGTSYGYEHEVVLLSDILIPETVKAGSSVELTAKLSWMICRDACVFQRDTQTIAVQTGTATSEPTAEWLALLKESGWDKK